MSTFFNSVHITNFKSLKDVTLSDCRRINLLIGKPNVGKSNILEAIGLFSLPYFKYNKSKKLTQFVRLENIAELFFDGNIEDNIIIETDDNSSCVIKYLERRESRNENLIHIKIDLKQNSLPGSLFYIPTPNISVDNRFNICFPVEKIRKNSYLPLKIKYYKFPSDFISKKQTTGPSFLIPPVGVNLLDVIEDNKLLKNEISRLFSEYGLRLLFDKTNHTLRIMKALKNDNEMISFPYSSIADTLQRIIFFKAAIASNKDSILLFEEPEAHCFPPYIAHFTQEVINSTSNQFFIATHSPYVLNDFLEYKRDDVAIFMADFKEGQTVINRLSDDEVNEVYEYGIDVFFNYERFTTHG